jgi:hypothetical protein
LWDLSQWVHLECSISMPSLCVILPVVTHPKQVGKDCRWFAFSLWLERSTSHQASLINLSHALPHGSLYFSSPWSFFFVSKRWEKSSILLLCDVFVVFLLVVPQPLLLIWRASSFTVDSTEQYM